MTALEIKDLHKSFNDLHAVRGVAFGVEPGEVRGFIGPNGAGKTTTMRICATLELPDRGDVLVEGRSVLADARGVRDRLGFMPDDFGVYANTTIDEYLDFFARALEVPRGERSRRIGDSLEFTSLLEHRQKDLTALSKGMRQRLCLAKTLLHDPRVLILDEPAAGLDPRARIELRDLVTALAKAGKAILVSSHILSELAEMCDSVAILERGELKAAGTLDEIRRGLTARASIRMRALAETDTVLRFLLEQPNVVDPHLDAGLCRFHFEGGDAEAADLLGRAVAANLRPYVFAFEERGLEQIFLDVTEGKIQ